MKFHTHPITTLHIKRPAWLGCLALLSLGTAVLRAQSTDTWVGGTDNTFGTAANWTYSAGTGPVTTGDSLVFGAAGFTNPTNNLSGFTFDAITFATGAQAYTLIGGAFTLGTSTPATAITVSSANNQTILTPIILPAAQTIALPGGNLTLGGTNSGAGGLTLAGPGTLTLTNKSWETYTGPTMVNGGTLALYFPNAGNSGLYLSSGLTINSGGTVAAVDNALAGSSSTLGSLPVTINAGGVLTGIAAADGGEGGSTHIRGLLTLNGGTVANAGTGVETAYGDWDFDDGVVVNGGTTVSTISAFDVIPDQAGGTVFNVVNGGTAGGVDLTVTGNLIHGSSLADTGIIKTNTGTVALWGTNTYTGATIINGGTLEINGAAELAASYAGAIAITNTGTFIYNSSQPQTLAGVISGGGTFNYSGGGALTLTGANTFAGSFINGGALTVNSTAAQTLSAVISGGGTLTQSGSGTLTLSGVNTYTGNTTVSGGGLAGVTGGSLASAVTVTPATGNSGTLGVVFTNTGSQWTIPSLTINPGGTYAALQFTFNSPPSTTTAPLNVTGTATFNTTPIALINPAHLAAGTYPLLVVGGTAPTTVPILSLKGFSGSSLAWNGNTLVLTVSGSASTTIDPLNWAASGSGTWDINDSGNAIWKDSSATPQAGYYQQLPAQIGDSVIFGDPYLSANTVVTLNSTVTPASIVVSNALNNYTITGSGSIAGTSGFTKAGTAALTISTTNPFTGGVRINGGTLTEDFTPAGAPTAGILGSANALTLGAATLTINGNNTTANTQTFTGTTFAAGVPVVINAASATPGATLPTLTLGGLTYGAGGTVVFNGPATSTGASTASGQTGANGNGTTTGAVAATATITTTTGGNNTDLIAPAANGAASDAAYATVGLYDFAGTVNAAAPYNIVGASQLSGGTAGDGLYTIENGNTLGTGGFGFIDAIGTITGNSSSTYINGLRFNGPGGFNGSGTAGSGAFTMSGILITPNVGANNLPFTGNYGLAPGLRNGTYAGSLVIWQNNTLGYLQYSLVGGIGNGKVAGGSVVQAGPGTVVYGNVVNSYTGPTYLNGGVTEIGTDAGLGAVATGAAVNLNGGTILGSATFALDNAGGNLRPVVLGVNGGGLAALPGDILTVDGVVSGALGTGPLVIGIPASAANGNVVGLVPGSGANTANTTPVYATGTVRLNNNTGNTFFGGVIVVGGATLNINGNYALGGLNYLGGLTLNNSTLQYNTALNSTPDITVSSGGVVQKVTILGASSIDINGNTVTYTNSIGNNANGSLTVSNSGSAGVGGLFLNGGITYTGGTTVAAGAALGGTNTIAGNVTWNTGSYAALSATAPLTVSGTVTLNNPTVQVLASGLTTGTYTLLTATGGITGGSTVNASAAGTGIVANGYGGTVSISGNTVILTVIQLGVAAVWTDALGDQNWSEGGNWTGGFAPQNSGDAATFGTGGVGQAVNLNVSETVGGVTFNNAASYTITGANTLTFNNKGRGAGISVTAGTANAINTAIALSDTFSATVNPGDSLTLGGIIANGSATETLTANGGGTLVLSSANTYGPAAGTVGTVLGGGTLQLGNSSALGAGDVSVTANSTLSAGATGLNLLNNLAVAGGHTLSVNNNGNGLTLSGVLGGNGTVAVSGAGAFVVGGANNTYTGGTLLNGGMVDISADGATAGGAGSLGLVPASSTPNNLIFNGGDLLATATLTLSANRGIGIGSASPFNTASTTAYLDAAAGQVFTIPSVIATAGNLGTNNLTINSEAGSTGTVVLGAANTFNGTNVIDAGIEQLANPLALQNSTLYYNGQGGVLDFGTQTAVTLGGLIGSQNLALVNDTPAAVALTLDNNNNIPMLYTGILGDNAAGGSLTVNGPGMVQQIGSGAVGGATYTGTTTINNGTLILGGKTALTGTFDVAALNGPSSATVQDSATITTTTALRLADAPGSGTYPGVSTLTVQGNAVVSAPSFSFGNTTRVPSSTVTVAGNGALNIAGDFELNSSEGGTAENNVVNLNGGVLTVGNFTLTDATVGTHQATLNFNGGVLAANASDPGGSQFLPNLTALTVNVLTNGLVVDPNSYDITIAATLAGAGGLTNIGTGTLNLAAANTYAGPTVVSNGVTLDVVNTTGSATGPNTVTVANGGTLGGTGTIAGNVIVNSGGTLTGTETITGNTTLLPGALATFTAASTPAPLIAGVVTLNNNVVTINVTGGTPLPIGIYKLMTYTVAGSTGAFNPTPAFTGAGVANGVQSTIATSGGVVTLTVAPNVTYNYWDVDANGNWTTASDWSGNPTVPGNPGDAALLGVGTAERTVTLNAAESLGYLTFSNANSFVIANAGPALTLDNSGNGAYLTVSGGTSNVIQAPVHLNDTATVTVYSGDQVTITGVVANSPSAAQPETLTLSGAGTLSLASANSYGTQPGSVGTILQGGILQAGNNWALGLGDVSVTGDSTLQAGATGLNLTNNVSIASGVTITVNDNGKAFELGGNIGGAGALTKVGNGTLTLTNNNGFYGGLTINAGTLILPDNSSGGGPVTNNATLQLANASAVGGDLTLDSGSTLQLRADTATTFSPSSLLPQNAADILTFDVGPVTTGTPGSTLTLGGTLAFTDSQANQLINVTGTNGYTLALGDLSAIAATSHNPYQLVDLNVLPGLSLTLSSFTCGNWGDFLDFSGGGNATVTGNLGNTSNGSVILLVDGGTSVTLQGGSNKTGAGDAYRYFVENGVLVADNSSALVNDTSGTLNNSSLFILGPATNIVYTGTTALPTGYQTVNTNNSVNCAFYLGDPTNLFGSITLAANVTNNVSDGDVGFTNNGVMTIGGLNASGTSTFDNYIILGWTPNRGKSVTLVAATGGEVDFGGGILANGTDTTAGITVGSAGFAGLVKLGGTNTYHGPTIITRGTLALANLNGYDAYIGNSAGIAINAGAVLDVTAQNSGTLPLGTGTVPQTLSGAGTLNGTLTVGSLGTVAPGSAAATGALTVSGSATLAGATVLKLNNAGSPANDELISPALTVGGTLTVTNIGPALVSGSTFHLFNTAVSGFTAITLPVADHNYKYTWTTNLAVNGTITLAAATPLLSTNAATANFRAVPVGNTLQFTWAPDHQGWQLYTNAVGLTAAGSWFPLAGTAAGTNATITINPAQPQVFFQLRYP